MEEALFVDSLITEPIPKFPKDGLPDVSTIVFPDSEDRETEKVDTKIIVTTTLDQSKFKMIWWQSQLAAIVELMHQKKVRIDEEKKRV